MSFVTPLRATDDLLARCLKLKGSQEDSKGLGHSGILGLKTFSHLFSSLSFWIKFVGTRCSGSVLSFLIFLHCLFQSLSTQVVSPRQPALHVSDMYDPGISCGGHSSRRGTAVCDHRAFGVAAAGSEEQEPELNGWIDCGNRGNLRKRIGFMMCDGGGAQVAYRRCKIERDMVPIFPWSPFRTLVFCPVSTCSAFQNLSPDETPIQQCRPNRMVVDVLKRSVTNRLLPRVCSFLCQALQAHKRGCCATDAAPHAVGPRLCGAKGWEGDHVAPCAGLNVDDGAMGEAGRNIQR